MHRAINFFKNLFNTDEWPARWHCGYWSPAHGWIYILSDVAIWISYFLIPVIILNYTSKKGLGIKFRRVYFLFAGFILFCGFTHFLDALMFWFPMYRFNTLVRFLTAVISMLTVYYLVKILPTAFKQKTSKELEMEIERRKTAEEKLEQANKELKAFAYVASHDIQEPLRKIRTFSGMLYTTNEKVLDEKGIVFLEKIISASDRLLVLVRDVLNLSNTKSDIEFHNVDLLKIIEIAKQDLELKIEDKKAVFNIGKLPLVKGNEAYLSQVFLNLINNAIKFTKPLVKPVITITGETINDRSVIKISDNGIGINKEDHEKIFEPFIRLHAKAKFEGSGLGLAICKRIIELQNGTISVTDNAEGGSTFIIDLPSVDIDK